MTTKKLAIYYSYPSLVNGSEGTVVVAANIFKEYDIVVFGETLELLSHPDHNKTVNIIKHPNMVNTEVYGYIDGTKSISYFKTHVDLWCNMGVKGVLIDQFGYDFGVTRAKQNNLVTYVHNKGLKAFIDAWNPDNVFSSAVDPTYNPSGLPPVVNSTDWYLAESYQIMNGEYQDANFWKTKADKMSNYRNIFGTKMACLTTNNSSKNFDQNKMNYGYYSCVLYNFDAFGHGEYLYSANSNLLPFRPRKPVYGTTFINNITANNGEYNRSRNVGISIDTTNHVVSSTL